MGVTEGRFQGSREVETAQEWLMQASAITSTTEAKPPSKEWT